LVALREHALQILDNFMLAIAVRIETAQPAEVGFGAVLVPGERRFASVSDGMIAVVVMLK
jgi:hypothetical protein